MEKESKIQTSLPDLCVLVGGEPRSGTTLLSSLLRNTGGHLQAFELHVRKPSFLVGLQGNYTRRIFKDLGLPEPDYNEIVENADFSGMNIGSWIGPKEEVSAEPLSGLETDNFLPELKARAGLVTKLMNKVTELNGDMSWGFKILGDVIYADYYAQAWPGAKFILMIRDPRDYALSVMKLNEQRAARQQPNFYDDYGAVAHGWTKTLRQGKEVLRVNKLSYIEVKYEDLVTNTVSLLKRLSDFLNLDFSNADHFYREQFIKKHTERFKHHNNLLNPINAQSVGKWKKTMTAVEVAIFRNIAGDLMDEYGYQ